MANLSKEDVLKLARLTKLELTEEEIETYNKELTEILGYVEQLSEADVKGLEATTQVTGLTNVLRADKVINYGIDQQSLLKNVPNRQGNSIKVKRVL